MGSLFVTFLMGCEKEYSVGDVPEERNPLQGTLTYDLNGEQMVADAKFVSNSVDDNDVKSLVIIGEKYSQDKIGERSDILTMSINYYEGPKMYAPENYFSSTLKLGSQWYHPFDPAALKNYILVPMGGNEEEPTEFLTIESDGDNFKGTFEFKMVYSNPSDPSQKDTLHIENGKFDIPN